MTGIVHCRRHHGGIAEQANILRLLMRNAILFAKGRFPSTVATMRLVKS
jgi:hypothetical protein